MATSEINGLVLSVLSGVKSPMRFEAKNIMRLEMFIVGGVIWWVQICGAKVMMGYADSGHKTAGIHMRHWS